MPWGARVGLVSSATAGAGREGSGMRVHEAPCVFLLFPLMIDAFQPSERGSLVETNKKKKMEWKACQKPWLPEECRWREELGAGGEASVALHFSRQQQQQITALNLLEAFLPLCPTGCWCTGHHVPLDVGGTLGGSM